MLSMLALMMALGGIATAFFLGLAWVRVGVRRRQRMVAQRRMAEAALLHQADSLGQHFRVVRKPLSLAAQSSLEDGAASIQWNDRLIARDRTNSQLIALVRCQSSCEETAGTAVFVWHSGGWRTVGQTLDGVSPEEVFRRHAKQLAKAA